MRGLARGGVNLDSEGCRVLGGVCGKGRVVLGGRFRMGELRLYLLLSRVG